MLNAAYYIHTLQWQFMSWKYKPSLKKLPKFIFKKAMGVSIFIDHKKARTAVENFILSAD
jgi:hypothetical protein